MGKAVFFGMVVAVGVALVWGDPARAQDCGDAQTPCEVAMGDYHYTMPEGTGRGIVVHLHGGGGRGAGLLRSHMAKVAGARGYVFVAPNGYHPDNRWVRDWSVRADNMRHTRDDTVFLAHVLADVQSKTGVAGPVLMSGFSRGGSMVWDMACRVPDFADAYAPMAGAFWEGLPKGCAGPVRLFHTHGWTDRVVPMEGRSFGGGTVVQGDVWASLAVMRETNGCAARQPERASFDAGQWLRHWADCAAGELQLLLHPGGHGAPKGWADRMLDWFENLPG